MDQMTQQNAAMVEQSTAAARSLTNEAQHLTALVVNFKLPDGGLVQSRRNDARPPVRASADVVRPKRKASRGNLALVQADDQQWNEF
jgi:methyl-accepting chemotaxis protein